MPYTASILKVEDFGRWESSFDREDSIAARKAAGEKSYQIFQTVDDPNNLVLLFEWDNLDNARKFVQSEKLRELMQQAGVIGKPDSYFLGEVEKGSM
jgi:heme-degrading monooxygenase HmoA